MTLMLNAQIGGSFAIMTSDFREVRVNQKIDHDTNEVIDVEGSKKVLNTRFSKVSKLSDYALVGMGGTKRIITHITDKLKNEVEQHHDLSDIKVILQRILDHDYVKRGRKYQLLRLKNGLSILVNGFYRDGNSGYLAFDSDSNGVKIVERKTDVNVYNTEMIVPFPDDYRDKVNDLFHIPLLYDVKFYENLEPSQYGSAQYVVIRNHLLNVHNVLAKHHPVEISEDIEIHTLANIGGKIKHGAVTLTPTKSESQHEMVVL